MFIDRHTIGYKPGDTKFKAGDTLMTSKEFLSWLEGPQQVAHVLALGASVWNVLFQGEDPEALANSSAPSLIPTNGGMPAAAAAAASLNPGDLVKVYLGVQGDPVSDWINLYSLTEKDLERWNDTKSKTWGGKKLEAGTCLMLMNDAYDMLEVEPSDSLVKRLELEPPSLVKCMCAGMCAMLAPRELAIMTLLPGAANRIVSKVMQLRQ